MPIRVLELAIDALPENMFHETVLYEGGQFKRTDYTEGPLRIIVDCPKNNEADIYVSADSKRTDEEIVAGGDGIVSRPVTEGEDTLAMLSDGFNHRTLIIVQNIGRNSVGPNIITPKSLHRGR
jgi:hypothetical protein